MNNFVVITPSVEKVLGCFEDLDSEIFRYSRNYSEKDSFKLHSCFNDSLSKFLKGSNDIACLNIGKVEIKEHLSNFGFLIYIFTRYIEDPESKYISKNNSFSNDYHNLKQLLIESKSADNQIEELKIYKKGKAEPVVLKNSEICTDMISFLDKKFFLHNLNAFRVIRSKRYSSFNSEAKFIRQAFIQFGKTLLLYIEKFFTPIKNKSIKYRIVGNILAISGYERFSETQYEAWSKEVTSKAGNKYNNYDHWLTDKTRHFVDY